MDSTRDRLRDRVAGARFAQAKADLDDARFVLAQQPHCLPGEIPDVRKLADAVVPLKGFVIGLHVPPRVHLNAHVQTGRPGAIPDRRTFHSATGGCELAGPDSA